MPHNKNNKCVCVNVHKAFTPWLHSIIHSCYLHQTLRDVDNSRVAAQCSEIERKYYIGPADTTEPSTAHICGAFELFRPTPAR